MTAYQAPNMNAHAERFVRSIRSHQGLGNEIPSGIPVQPEGGAPTPPALAFS
jgi:hypothetical protein